MNCIKNFKKGDCVVFTQINEDNKIIKRNLIAYYITNNKIIFGTYKKYHIFKYFLEIDPDKLIDAEIIEKKEFINKYENYEIEIHKYKNKEDKYFSDYCRAKKDYNWKYELALGLNEGYVNSKKELIKSYYEDLSKIKSMCNISKKHMEESCRNLIEGLSPKMNSHSTFIVNRGGMFSGINIPKNKDYYCTILKNYNLLNQKYKRKIDSDINCMLLDFQKIINTSLKNNYFTNIEKIIIELMLGGKTNEKEITDYINSNFKLDKPIKPRNVIEEQDIIIPKKIYDSIDEDSGETNG